MKLKVFLSVLIVLALAVCIGDTMLRFPGLSRPARVRGDSPEARVRILRLVDEYGGDYKDIQIYQVSGSLVITRAGDGADPDTLISVISQIQFAGSLLRIWSLNPNLDASLEDAYITLNEIAAPAAPDANHVRIFAQDNGAGKTQLMARFATGATQQIAIEP